MCVNTLVAVQRYMNQWASGRERQHHSRSCTHTHTHTHSFKAVKVCLSIGLGLVSSFSLTPFPWWNIGYLSNFIHQVDNQTEQSNIWAAAVTGRFSGLDWSKTYLFQNAAVWLTMAVFLYFADWYDSFKQIACNGGIVLKFAFTNDIAEVHCLYSVIFTFILIY